MYKIILSVLASLLALAASTTGRTDPHVQPHRPTTTPTATPTLLPLTESPALPAAVQSDELPVTPQPCAVCVGETPTPGPCWSELHGVGPCGPTPYPTPNPYP